MTVKAKYVYYVWTDAKQVLTNKRSCPNCGEHRRIERLVTFIIHPQMGLFKPFRCKSCGFHINVATGDRLEHINKVGRDYPLDRTLYPDVPLFGEKKDEANELDKDTAGNGTDLTEQETP